MRTTYLNTLPEHWQPVAAVFAAMDLALSLEGAQGATIANLELLVTVRDCLLAASGQLGETCADSPAPAGWFAPAADQKLAIPKHAATIADAFLTQVRSAPAQPLLADRASLRSRRDILMRLIVKESILLGAAGES